MTAGDLGFSPCGVKQTGFAEARRVPHPFALFAKGWEISGVKSASSELALSEAEGAGFSQNRGKVSILILCWGDLIRTEFAVRIRARL